MTPNQARYGINLDTCQGLEDDPPEGEIPLAKDRVKDLDKLRAELESNWRTAKENQAKYYNQRHAPIEYNVGEIVLLLRIRLKPSLNLCLLEPRSTDIN